MVLLRNEEMIRVVREIEAMFMDREDFDALMRIIEEMANIEARRMELAALLSKMRRRRKNRDLEKERELHEEYAQLGMQKAGYNAALNRLVAKIVKKLAIRRAGL